MPDPMFTEHVRDNLPLGRLLDQWARPPRENAESVSPEVLANNADDAIVDRLLADWGQHTAPLQFARDPEMPSEPRTAERRDQSGSERLSMWRWIVGFPLNGDIELLSRWPKQLLLEPTTHDEYYLPVPEVTWRLMGSSPYAYFDVPREDDREGVHPPADRINAAANYLATAVAAINDEVAAYDERLRAELLETVRQRRERIGVIAKNDRAIIALVRETLAPLTVERAEEPEKAPLLEAPNGIEIRLDYLVAAETFDDLVVAVRKWRTGVERYGDDWSKLDEEGITSLLVTSLNLRFDTAQREVYHSRGKTDILVQAGIKTPNEAAFIGEAKIWYGQAKVCGSINQLLGYAVARTTSLLLLYYVRQANLGLMSKRALEAIEGCDAFVAWAEDDGADRVAIVRHPTFDTDVRIRVLFVHIPTEDALDPDET